MSRDPGEAFYGWQMVGIAFAMHALATGATLHVFGVFLKPVAEEFGTSRMLTVLGPALAALLGACVSPFLGRWLDRGAAHVVIVSGGLVMAVGFGTLAMASSATAFAASYALLIGLGTVMLGPMTASKLVTSWFARRRGRALGISTIGSSLGGFVFPPLVVWAIALAGWRGAYLALALVVAVVFVPSAWRWVVDTPERIGQHPDGAAGPALADSNAADEAARAADERDWTTRELLRSGTFWSVAVSVGLVFFAIGMIIIHLVSFATDQGISLERAAWIQSSYAVSAGVGKYLFGQLADRITLRAAFVGAIALQMVGWSGLLLDPGAALLTASMVAIGLSAGGRLPVWSAMLASGFGVRSFGRAMGIMSPIMLPMAFAGPPLAGYIHDETGSYQLALQIGFVVLLAAAAVALTLKLPRREATAVA